MTTVTLNGNTYNDTSTPPLNLGNGGHRTNLLPMLTDAVVDLAAKQAAALASQNAASASASTATTQAGNSSTSASTATTQAGISTTQAGNSAASASAALASQNLAADWADKLTEVVTGRYSAKYWATQAQASVTCQLIYRGGWDASGNTYPPAPVTGDFYKITVAGTLSGYPVMPGDDIIYNGATWDVIDNSEAAVTFSTYANRAGLRAMSPTVGNQAIVESLGLFRWYSASTEPDDDETCFVTASGAWLLELPHWDVADAMRTPDESAQDDRAEDAETRLTSSETRWPGRWMFGAATSGITSVSSLAQVSFTCTVLGAAINDYVIATPPNALDPRISVFARVTATDTITVYLNNPSASGATLVSGSFEIAIFKEI